MPLISSVVWGTLDSQSSLLLTSSPLSETAMAAPNLEKIHDFLVSLAFQAGDIITNALPGTGGTGSKKNSTLAFSCKAKPKLIFPGADLVTEYDRAVENMISTSLKDKYPDYA